MEPPNDVGIGLTSEGDVVGEEELGECSPRWPPKPRGPPPPDDGWGETGEAEDPLLSSDGGLLDGLRLLASVMSDLL